MNEQDWLKYYRYMVEREMKPAKKLELVANCGGVKLLLLPDPKSTLLNPLPALEVEETLDEAFTRIKGEILTEVSRGTLERKADELIAAIKKVR